MSAGGATLKDPAFAGNVLAYTDQAFLMLDGEGAVLGFDGAAENILAVSGASLMKGTLKEFGALGLAASELLGRIKGRRNRASLYDFAPGGELDNRRFDLTLVALDSANTYLLTIHPRGQTAALIGQGGRHSLMMSHLSEALAHEIRNPLSGIRAAAQLMGRALPDGKTHLSDMVVQETDRLAALVGQLETLTDRRTPTLEALNVHEVLHHVLGLMEPEVSGRLDLETFFDPSLPLVWADRDALIQVLINLVRNAAEAQKKGPVRFRVSSRYRLGFRRPDSGGTPVDLPIEIELIDEGPGVAPALEADLFDPFVTDKEGGKGLGLALVAYLMEDMGGSVRHERNTPNGARFFLNLKRAEET